MEKSYIEEGLVKTRIMGVAERRGEEPSIVVENSQRAHSRTHKNVSP